MKRQRVYQVKVKTVSEHYDAEGYALEINERGALTHVRINRRAWLTVPTEDLIAVLAADTGYVVEEQHNDAGDLIILQTIMDPEPAFTGIPSPDSWRFSIGKIDSDT